MKFARLVLRNLIRNRRRTILTVIAIATSICLFSAAMTLPAIVNVVLAANAGSHRVVCFNKANMFYEVPASYQSRIASAAHVKAVAAWVWFGGTYQDPHYGFPNFGVDQDQFATVWPDSTVNPAQLKEFSQSRTACLVGKTTLETFHFHLGQTVSLRDPIYQRDASCRIVGVVGNSSNLPSNGLWFRRDYIDALRGSRGVVTMYWLYVDQQSAIPSVIASLDESFANSDSPMECASEGDFNAGLFDFYRGLFSLAEAIGLLVVVVIGLVAANTAAMSVRERRGEIAVLRAMGFSQPLVTACLVCEFTLIGLLGGALGCALGTLALRAMRLSLLAWLSMDYLPASVTVIAPTVASVVGAASGLIPALSAVRRDIVSQLRIVN